MAERRELSLIETLPPTIQTDIFVRLAKISRLECRNLMAAIPPFRHAAAVPRVFQNLNIHALTVRPLISLDKYHDLMEHCLANGHLEAHYVRGIQNYFHHNNEGGLTHLKIAAEGSYENAIYLYSVVMLARGEAEIGKSMLDSLGWRENTRRADTCWRRIKRSLHGITVTRLPVYIATYMGTRATIECHMDNVHTRCDNCFYYKQLTKFVFMI